MKKYFMFFVLFVAFVTLNSCSSNTGEELIVRTSDVMVDGGSTVEALQKYNSSLLKFSGQTRGSRRLEIAAADIVGAASGVNAGKTLAGLVGAATGGTGFAAIVIGAGLITGASSSYLAYKRHAACSYVEDTSRLFDYTKKAVCEKFVMADNDALTEGIYEVDDCKDLVANMIGLPTEFNYIRTLGADHNTILLAANVEGDLPSKDEDCNLEQVMLSPEDFSKFNEAMNCRELKDVFCSSMKKVESESRLDALVGCSERVKQALQGYLDLFQSYPENVNDLVEIANGYIKIIEEQNEFSKEEKELIYSAIMVSVYSPQLWDNYK